MAYTEETVIVGTPSLGLAKLMKELREHKLAQLEKLRNQAKCTFQLHL